MINYQGRLVNSNGVPLATGDYDLTFNIYDAATNGLQIWGPQVFDGQAGAGHGAKIPVVQGYFNSILGPTDTAGRAIEAARNGATRYLEIRVGTNPPILPRQQVLTAPYAFRASHADTASSVLGSTTTGNLTLYVSTNGVDLNDGLTPATAKRNIQTAINTIPYDVRHAVKISLAPGTYFEYLNIFNKFGGEYYSIAIEGVVTNPALVRIDGLAEGGRLPFAFLVKASGLAIRGVTFTNQSAIAVLAVEGSTIELGSCNLDVERGLEMDRYVKGTIEDCIFRSPPAGGAVAIHCEEFTRLSIRNNALDHDPMNTINNSINGYGIGIQVIHGAIVLGSPVFSGNTQNVQTNTGGLHFP
jgi:hypothetical protein